MSLVASSQSSLLILPFLPDLLMLECPHISVLSPLLFSLYPEHLSYLIRYQVLNTIYKLMILKFIDPSPDLFHEP